jgi:hypothetical protein
MNDYVDVSGPSCPNRPFSTELGDTEITTQIWGVLAHGVHLNFGSDSILLREGVDRPWVSPLELLLVYLCQFLLLKTHVFYLCIGSQVCTERPTGGHLT